MTDPDLVGSPVSPAVAQPVAAGAFVPDVATIERLANAFFMGWTGGGPAAPPSVPASPPAPWTAPAPPSAPVAAEAAPVQPPFGAVDVPANVPSSVPLRSFGGASAGSASPFAFAQSRAVAPAASQTAIAAPRVDPIEAAGRLSPVPVETSAEGYVPTPGVAAAPSALSPFSQPLDLSAAMNALALATGLAPLPAPGFAAPGYGASGVPDSTPGDVTAYAALPGRSSRRRLLMLSRARHRRPLLRLVSTGRLPLRASRQTRPASTRPATPRPRPTLRPSERARASTG